MNDRHETIKVEAYYLWERLGRPNGNVPWDSVRQIYPEIAYAFVFVERRLTDNKTLSDIIYEFTEIFHGI